MTDVWVVTGGIGSGKSTIRQTLDELGAITIDADRVGHEVLEPDGAAYRDVAETWPEVVVDGRVDRSRLASVVFSDPEELARLEAISHPAIAGEIASRIADADEDAVVVVEISVPKDLLGVGWLRTIVADLSDAERMERLIERGMDPGDVQRRMAAQPDREGWRELGRWAVPTSGSREAVALRVRRLWQKVIDPNDRVPSPAMSIDPALDQLIVDIPKAELHVHIEGTLEPEMMFALAARNGVVLPWTTLEEVEAAYDFTDLQSFLDVYYQGAAALVTEQDFDDLMWAYLKRAAADGVRHAEIFFDPQTHTHRDIGFDVFMAGFRRAMARADAEFGMSTSLIMCFVRHLSVDDAVNTVDAARGHLDGVVAVGLDSSEKGIPPEPYAEAYRIAGELGLRAVAHAGEEGPPEYVRGALDVLRVERVDHGVRSLEDPELVGRLRDEQIPLTVCPLSNVRLRVVDTIADHPMRRMMDEGLLVTVNSDDPAYFGGYVADNYRALVTGLGFGHDEIVRLARNSIVASFLPEGRKQELLTEITAISS